MKEKNVMKTGWCAEKNDVFSRRRMKAGLEWICVVREALFM